MALPWWIPFGKVPEVDPETLQAELAGGAPPLLLDVRTAREFEAGHLDGAIHVPITSLAATLPGLGLDMERRIVAICLSGHRSIPAVRLLRRHGIHARQLEGGMMAWRAAGLPEVVGG
jgi:rhodanese-related sulfurtransferase